MPVNRNALIRYKTIDRCLQNHYRRWTLEDLIEACSEALYEYEGIDKGVSRRSVQADIQMMRSDKLGYNAPIVVVERKYYTYEDSDYSITNIPLTEQDLSKLGEAVEFMKQFQGFSHFRELDGMVQKLEDHIHSQQTQSQPAIDFEKNDNLKGLEYLDRLYRAIIQQQTLRLTYQSFKARFASEFDFFPYLLKEFRNRWFLIGIKKAKGPIFNLALDRIQGIESSEKPFQGDPNFDAAAFFRNSIGVSVSSGLAPEIVTLFFTHQHAPYVLTKPLHHSQQLLNKDYFGITVSLLVQHNFELEKLLLGFGEGVKVIAPDRLRRTIQERLATAVDTYETDLSDKSLYVAAQKLQHKGHSILHQVYTRREVKMILRYLERERKEQSGKEHAQRAVLEEIPPLKELLFNRNLRRIVAAIDPAAFLTKSLYFDKTPHANWWVSWHQDVPINVVEQREVPGYDKWTRKEGTVSVRPPESVCHNRFSLRIHLDDTDASNGALNVLAGSHQQILSDAHIHLITQNSLPHLCEVPAGGIHLMKPLLLHASSRSKSSGHRRVLHLEFASQELAGGLEWAEKWEF